MKDIPDLTPEIKARAKFFAEDNLDFPTLRDYLVIENAMLIGASIALESLGEKPTES